jgi:hypothetical protein
MIGMWDFPLDPEGVLSLGLSREKEHGSHRKEDPYAVLACTSLPDVRFFRSHKRPIFFILTPIDGG